MYYDTPVEILADRISSPIEIIEGDLQPHVKKYIYEDGFELEATKRLFFDRVPSINIDSYVRVEMDLYKVLEIKEWSDHLEVFLYPCRT